MSVITANTAQGIEKFRQFWALHEGAVPGSIAKTAAGDEC
jgi:hypothetical protein